MSKKVQLEKLWEIHKAKNPYAWCYPARWGVEGYGGTDPISIVSFQPSGDLDFESRQARAFYEALKSYGLAGAHLIDVLSSTCGYQKEDEAAFFLAQLKIVEPRVLLVMDMSNRDHLWATPMPFVKSYPKGHEFSFAIHRIYHYTKLAWGENRVKKWHAQLSAVLRQITFERKANELTAELCTSPDGRQEVHKCELELKRRTQATGDSTRHE